MRYYVYVRVCGGRSVVRGFTPRSPHTAVIYPSPHSSAAVSGPSVHVQYAIYMPDAIDARPEL